MPCGGGFTPSMCVCACRVGGSHLRCVCVRAVWGVHTFDVCVYVPCGGSHLRCVCVCVCVCVGVYSPGRATLCILSSHVCFHYGFAKLCSPQCVLYRSVFGT